MPKEKFFPEIITNLPNGYASILGKYFYKGSQLSIGEWQKIAVARAFMRDSKILILDEPTASLDVKTEYEIFNQFKNLTKHKMTVLISHRFSTVRMADKIYVLENGITISVLDENNYFHSDDAQMIFRNDTILLKWNNNIKRQYEDLGYEYTGRFRQFQISVLHLSLNSPKEVLRKCPNCGETKKAIWQNLMKQGHSKCF